jgi:hypothetical protein
MYCLFLGKSLLRTSTVENEDTIGLLVKFFVEFTFKSKIFE